MNTYKSILNEHETEHAIKLIKDTFQMHLANALCLKRVTAPLFVKSNLGLNDTLTGVEKPVSFVATTISQPCEIVHSLAKWKRMKLHDMHIEPGYGIYTDMNAIRADEELDNIHSLYVDQWDWEKVITEDSRRDVLYDSVKMIYNALLHTEYAVYEHYPQLKPFLPKKFKWVTSEELLRLYPNLTPKERENEICKRYGAVFICGIGSKLSNGQPHGDRAPDYDDWSTPVCYAPQEIGAVIQNNGLNGDLLIWYEPLNQAIELSSMGVRVNAKALATQLELSGKTEYAQYKYHKMVLNNELPQTIGGGIGQSRVCMVLLQKMHIGEVQSSIWSDEMIQECHENNINILQ